MTLPSSPPTSRFLNPLVAALAAGACQLVGCSSSDGDDGGGTTTQELDPGPGAFDPDFETSSDFFTRMDGARPGLESSPHGTIQIWYSTNIESVIAESSFVAPEGTVAIKSQDQDDDGEVENILVMIKQARGSSPDTGDWLFEVRAADGTVQTSGGSDVDFCAGCHELWPDTSYLAGTTLVD